MYKFSYDVLLIARTRCHSLLAGWLSSFREPLSQSDLLGKIHSCVSFHTQEALPHTHTHNWIDCIVCVRGARTIVLVFNARKMSSIKFYLHDDITLVESFSVYGSYIFSAWIMTYLALKIRIVFGTL